MRILQTIFPLNDYGGIVIDVELLARGLTELGHQCNFMILKCDDLGRRTKKEDTHIPGTYKSVVANQANTIYGWYGASVLGYGSKEGMQRWADVSSHYDLVIHQVPVPKPDPEGYWRQLFQKCQAKQISHVHDAHFPEMYPHMIEIAPYLSGVNVPNIAAYASLAELPAPRALIGVPYELTEEHLLKLWQKRRKRFVSAHVWKPWKKMDRVLRALPHLDGVQNVIGGDGIEARYMRSKDKCKPRYKGLWKQAERAGMNYMGLLANEALAAEYRNARVMVDLSFSKKFAKFGSHFNRSVFEGANNGCIPLCVSENMLDTTGFLDPELHYLSMPEKDTHDPRLVADAIEWAVNTMPHEAETMVQNLRELIRDHFEYHEVAQGFVDMAKGKKKLGVYNKTEVGTATKSIRAASKKIQEEAEA